MANTMSTPLAYVILSSTESGKELFLKGVFLLIDLISARLITGMTTCNNRSYVNKAELPSRHSASSHVVIGSKEYVECQI